MSEDYQGYQKKLHNSGILQERIRINKEAKAEKMDRDAKAIQENAKREETERILNKEEVTQEEINKVFDDYGKEDKYKEYLVNGAVLTCNQATTECFNQYGVHYNGIQKTYILPLFPMANESDEEFKNRIYTTLDVTENPISDNGLIYATVKDTVKNTGKGGNISPFRCHCKVMPRLSKLTEIRLDPKAVEEGVCKHLMELNPEWENLPRTEVSGAFAEESYKEVYDIHKDETADEPPAVKSEGIMMTSILFCKHGGIITPVTSGQTDIDTSNIEFGSSENVVKETTISLDYFRFLVKYEGLGDTWQYAEELRDGTVTIAFGVVLRDSDGRYLLGEDVYNKYINMKKSGIPLTEKEACLLTEKRLQDFIEVINLEAKDKNWSLSQNQFDALVDMVWNINPNAVKFTAAELIATGDLNDPIVRQRLEKEILETAHAELDSENVWAKNLVERRLDVVRIAEGGSDAYTKNEFTAQWWNQNAEDFLLEKGLEQETIDKYKIQIAEEY